MFTFFGTENVLDGTKGENLISDFRFLISPEIDLLSLPEINLNVLKDDNWPETLDKTTNG
jgi:hypothetical protein